MLRAAVLAALALAPAALGANVADERMRAVASWAAQKPVGVHCENDEAEWDRLLRTNGLAGRKIGGFAYAGDSTVYISPNTCAWLVAGPARPDGFGVGLLSLLHEATHARGWVDEALTECAARVLIYTALERFYGVRFFTPEMRMIVGVALAWSRTLPAAYQGGCDRL